MHHYAKRLLALFLALLLCLSLFPAAALAEETEEPAAPAEDGVPGEGPGEDDPPAEGELPEITAEDPVSLDEGADPAALPPAEDETEEAAASGACGENLTWSFDEDDGTLTISGSGYMWNWVDGGAPWYAVPSQITRVVIEPGVTSIGKNAFQNCSSLTEVTIPEGVTSIGEGAFYNCSILTEVTIPEGVSSIRHHAFQYCSSLTEVTIPEGVTSIGSYAFSAA